MVFVVCAIDFITTFPARRKHELEANSVNAVGIKIVLLGEIVAIESTLRVLGVVQTIEPDGALSKIRLGSLTERCPGRLVGIGLSWVAKSIVATESITSNHLETSGESSHFIAVKQIVAMSR